DPGSLVRGVGRAELGERGRDHEGQLGGDEGPRELDAPRPLGVRPRSGGEGGPAHRRLLQTRDPGPKQRCFVLRTSPEPAHSQRRWFRTPPDRPISGTRRFGTLPELRISGTRQFGTLPDRPISGAGWFGTLPDRPISGAGRFGTLPDLWISGAGWFGTLP